MATGRRPSSSSAAKNRAVNSFRFLIRDDSMGGEVSQAGGGAQGASLGGAVSSEVACSIPSGVRKKMEPVVSGGALAMVAVI